MRKAITLLFSGIFTGSLAIAEELPDTLRLDEINVTATSSKTNVELLPLDVTIVNNKEIEQSTESSLMPILVNNVAGLFVTERGLAGYGVSGGAAGTVNIRGVGQGNKVLFMIDGQPQWAGVFGHSLPDTYVANGVERIEVVKGPSSLLYGSSAMGGSINIITKRATQDGFTGRARAMAGSYSTQKFDVSGSFRQGKFGGTVSGQFDRSNGIRENSRFWDFNEFMQLQYDISNNWQTGANINLTQSKANNPGTLQSPLLSMWTLIRRGTAAFFVKDNYAGATGGFQAYLNWGHHNVDDGYAPGGTPRDYIFHSYDYNGGFTFYQTVHPWQSNDLSVGLDFQHWGGETWNTMKSDGERVDGVNKSENEVGVYAMMQQSLANDVISLNAGARFQHGSSYGNIWVPQAGFILKPLTDTSIKFSFSKGFRAPNIRELYMYAPANRDLKPEQMFNYEISLSQALFDHKLHGSVAFFYIDGKDMIQTTMIDGRPLNTNTGKFRNKGFEIEMGYHINRNWTVTANYSYLYTDNKTLVGAPKNKLNGRVDFTTGGLSMSLESNSIWSLQNGNPDNETCSYSLLNYRIGYSFGNRVKFMPLIKLDNITDSKYEIIYGCPMPGFTIMGGIEIKF